MKTELIAPCGMNCALCSGYLALQYDVKSKGIRMPYCKGCRPRDKNCAFLKKKRGLLLNKSVMFCFECPDFPCERLKRLDKRYQKLFRMSMIENLQELKEKGMETFLENQERKYKCPKCGDIICVHDGKCYSCGYIQTE
jgi:transposase